MKAGIAFLDKFNPDWRPVVRRNSLAKEKSPLAPDSATNLRPRRKDLRLLNEFIEKDCIISRLCDAPPERALRALGLTRDQAEDLGFYFKEANPHDLDAVMREYAVLSKLWNGAVYGENSPALEPAAA
ncbi:MAG: hypothetical protein ACREGR_00020 [Minisyncoccia bacterium]